MVAAQDAAFDKPPPFELVIHWMAEKYGKLPHEILEAPCQPLLTCWALAGKYEEAAAKRREFESKAGRKR